MGYLVKTAIGAGGSWIRDNSLDMAIKALQRLVRADWGSLYDLSGAEIEVEIYDVGDRSVHFDRRKGVTDSDTDEAVECQEVRKVTLPKTKIKKPHRR
jgi:hypothetical protein